MPRVLGPGAQPKITGDLALDLKTGWDCRRKEDRMWALAEVKRRKPKVVGLTPPCQMLCTLQNLSLGKRTMEWEKLTGLAAEEVIFDIFGPAPRA